VLRADVRTDLSCRTRVYLNPSTLVRLEKLIGRNGDARTAAAIRVAIRRLLDDPGDLTAYLGTIGAARDLTPETLGPRTNVHFDDDLRGQLDALRSARLEPSRTDALGRRPTPGEPAGPRSGGDRGDLPRGREPGPADRPEHPPADRGPGHRRAPCPHGAEPAREPLGKRHVFRLDEDTKRRLEDLADEYGPRRLSALLRVGVRRLIENPAADEALAQARRVAAPPRTARVDVALDDELLAHLDALADRLGSDRQELVHLAATRILRFHHNIENWMLDEMFRAPNSRKHLLAKHARRERIRRRDRGSGT
jgi:predicted transcriptional regulator